MIFTQNLQSPLLAIRTCLQPEGILQEDFSDDAKRQILHANVVHPLEAILEAFGEPLDNLTAVLGGDQESIMPVTRSALKTRNSSSTSIRSFGSTTSVGVTPGLVELSSADAKTDLDAMPAARWFQDLETYVHPLTTTAPIPRVRVAILDSGIDLPEEMKWAYPDRITYRSWIEGDDTDGADMCGHGTHAAGLLLQVSDHAEIYVARIKQSGKPDELDPNIIAEAITYATDVWQVDIITMSFGFSEPQPVIDTALTHAAGTNTVLLAAASNSGNRHSIAWPARAEQVICIHSLLGDGDRSPFTPNSRPQDFGILGQAVSSYWPPHLNEGSSVLRSGTSCATPIAAGVAALVLEFTQHRLPQRARPGSQVDQHVIRKLRSNAGMRMVFELMVEHRDHQNCIIPWKLLNHERNEQTMCDQILEKLRTM